MIRMSRRKARQIESNFVVCFYGLVENFLYPTAAAAIITAKCHNKNETFLTITIKILIWIHTDTTTPGGGLSCTF